MLHRDSNTCNTYCAIGNLQYTWGMERLGALIEAARERSGLKGYEVARRLGKQPSYVSRLENGDTKTLPPPHELRQIGQAIDLSVEEMLRAAGYIDDDAPDDAAERVIDELRPLMREIAWSRSRVNLLRAALEHYRDTDHPQPEPDRPGTAAPGQPARIPPASPK